MSQKSVTTREWFRDAFDARYLEVYPWRDEIAAEREVCSAIDWLRAIPGHRFLDLCCGAGRHSLWLKKAGLDLVSLDLSDDLLAEARRNLGADALLVRSDVRALPFAAESFDHVAMFFTSFGYLATDDENLAVLEEVARVVRTDGGFLLDLPDRKSLITGLVPSSHRSQGDLRIEETRSISKDGKRVEKQVLLIRGEEEHTYTESVRLYEIEELESMLLSSGWDSSRVYGNWAGDPYLAGQSERMILVARRAEEN